MPSPIHPTERSRDLVAVVCDHCGASVAKMRGYIKRFRESGRHFYCNRECAVLGRRKSPYTKDELRTRRVKYTREYEAKNRSTMTAKRKAYRNEHRERIAASKRIARAKQCYGEFWEAYLIFLDINIEVNSRASREEIYRINQIDSKAQGRKRDAESQRKELERCTVEGPERYPERRYPAGSR